MSNVIMNRTQRVCTNLDLTVPVEQTVEERREKGIELQEYVKLRRYGVDRASKAVTKEAELLGCL